MGETFIEGPLYAARKKVYPQAVSGTFRRIKWTLLIAHARRLLPAALRALGPRAEPAQPGRARRHAAPALLLLLHRAVAAGGLLSSPACSIIAAMALFLMNAVAGRIWCGYLCPQTVWTDLFYAVERWVEGDRRERMKKDKGGWDVELRLAEDPQALDLADDRLVDRRRLGALLRRCADAGARPRDLPGAAGRLSLDRHPHLHHLYAGRPHARAGVHLHVPVAAHPGGADRRIRAERHLPATTAASRACR